MRFLPLVITPLMATLALPVPALADGFCNVTDRREIQSRLVGNWQREGTMTMVNATTDLEFPSDQYITEFFESGLVFNKFFDETTGAYMPFTLSETVPYDVDKVDDMLETTGREDFADILSDTLCGPEQLPQLVVTLDLPVQKRSERAGVPDLGLEGAVTFIAYFDDRLLEIRELTVKSEETVIFITETALLRPADPKGIAKEE